MIKLDRKFYNKNIREILKLTRTELAHRVEVTRQTIYNYEMVERKAVNRPLERVIEWELDKAIEECSNMRTRTLCDSLKHRRDANT